MVAFVAVFAVCVSFACTHFDRLAPLLAGVWYASSFATVRDDQRGRPVL